MSEFIRFIEVDCKGESTKQPYKGSFEVRMFLTHKEKQKLNSNIRQHVGNTALMAAAWDIKSFVSALDALPEDGDDIFISNTTKNYILALVGSCLPSVPQIDNLVTSTLILNAHVINAPEWWKKSNNGLDLLDEQPIVELNTKLNSLLEEFFKEGEEEEEKED